MNWNECPYCEHDTIRITGDEMSGFAVHCETCGMSGPIVLTELLAIMGWNVLPRKKPHTETST